VQKSNNHLFTKHETFDDKNNNIIFVKLALCIFQSELIAEQSKLENVKLVGARSKINAISLNMQINKQKSVDICGYILPINVQNFMQKDSAQAKISSKVVLGYFFDSPCTSHNFYFLYIIGLLSSMISVYAVAISMNVLLCMFQVLFSIQWRNCSV